jgi:hypothetical protein
MKKKKLQMKMRLKQRMNKMDKTKTTVPQSACVFEQGCEVKFADSDDTETKNRFSIVAYSGQVIPNHFWWGNIAFDLEGIKFAKAKTPVLQEHFREDRIGFSTKQDISDKVTLEGKFLSNSKAQELRNDMLDGFPMQASMYLPPTLIEQVKEGETVEVNGHKLKGPGAVFRKGKICEVSMCTLGADSHTQSKAFAEGGKHEIGFNVIEKEQDMAEKKLKTELTAETFAAEHPVLFEEIQAKAKAEGEKETRELFGEFVEQFGDDPAFCIEQFKAGVSLDEAVRAENVKLKKAAASTAKQTQQTAAEETDPAVQEFSDEQTAGDQEQEDKEGKPASFNAAVEARVKEANCSKGEAMKFAIGEYPELYKKFRAEIEAEAEKNQRD